MDIYGQIESIQYKPILAQYSYNEYELSDLGEALDNTTFLLNHSGNKFAFSRWVSPKRTRSYPFERVYNTMGFPGKRVTVIPIIKDEGVDGERDYLQWDTISLMSLMDVYIILAYYDKAEKNMKYSNKITNQRLDVDYIRNRFNLLLSFHSNAFHWNMAKIDNVESLMNTAIEKYRNISGITGVTMSSEDTALARIRKLGRDRDSFMKLSRELAYTAQQRESITVQPKEFVTEGEKAAITISNYQGGYYYLTADEARIDKNNLYLVEAKHTASRTLPSLSVIKEGLFKMVLFTNLSTAIVDNHDYDVVPILKLTSSKSGNLSDSEQSILEMLHEEANTNGFAVEYTSGGQI
ncbi:MAG: hypothetical protein FWG88_04205 [Oscillospiraceae bacterium]|nr:hypothetical protein [Oscillospiraceae bacterium]